MEKKNSEMCDMNSLYGGSQHFCLKNKPPTVLLTGGFCMSYGHSEAFLFTQEKLLLARMRDA